MLDLMGLLLRPTSGGLFIADIDTSLLDRFKGLTSGVQVDSVH
jgi:hypothetical protein